MLGHYQKHTLKQPNIAELKSALLSIIWNDLPHEFIDKAIPLFQQRLDFRVLLQLVGILNTAFSLNTEVETDGSRRCVSYHGDESVSDVRHTAADGDRT